MDAGVDSIFNLMTPLESKNAVYLILLILLIETDRYELKFSNKFRCKNSALNFKT